MPQLLSAPIDGTRAWFGMDDYEVVSPDKATTLYLPYITEPPHGDSLHRVKIADWTLSGLAWGNGLAWSPCSRYVVFDWTPDLGQLTRKNLVIDHNNKRALVLEKYVHFTKLVWPTLSFKRGDAILAGEQERVLQLGTLGTWSAA